jgi:hypothetical protein
MADRGIARDGKVGDFDIKGLPPAAVVPEVLRFRFSALGFLRVRNSSKGILPERSKQPSGNILHPTQMEFCLRPEFLQPPQVVSESST